MGIIKPPGGIERTLDKKQIESLAESHARQVADSGRYDMLRVYTELKRYELYLKTIIDNIKGAALEKALQTGEKTLEVDNARITVYKRKIIDFSADAKWRSLKGDLDYLLNMRKKREALLKELKPGEVRKIVDENTGEVEEVVAPPVEIKSGLVVKF